MVSQTMLALLAVIGIVLYRVYQLALPRPIPGIPRNSDIGLLGDVPAMLKYAREKQQIYSFMTGTCSKLGSPIVQLFVRPFSRPWVIVSDPDVAYDCLMRRSPSDFDRSNLFGDILLGLVPYHHVRMPATDERMKGQKRLMAETMSPAFLSNVAAPKLHAAVQNLMKLWTIKAKLAGPSRAFYAVEDIKNAMLDAIWEVAAGQQAGATDSQINGFNAAKSPWEKPPRDEDDTVTFKEFKVPELCHAMVVMDNSAEAILTSPFPKEHHWLLRQFPGLKAALKCKQDTVVDNLKAALKRVESGESPKCAADLVLGRVLEQGKVDVNSPVLRDELFGFLAAGHDISSTTIGWAVKHLSDNRQIQEKLRSSLRQYFPDTNGIPSASEIAKTRTPYLDAVVEEVGRCTAAQPATSRVTVKDTQLMGYMIPKGTDIFFMTDGPGYLSRPIPAPRGSKEGIPRKASTWDENDLGKFMPERWLRERSDGEQEFDPNAGPCHPFGLGARGCFGKKLALLEMRIFFVVMIMTFDLMPAPERLRSYESVDKLNHNPKHSYVRLSPLV